MSYPNCRGCPAFSASVFRELGEAALDQLQKEKRPLERHRGDTLNRQGAPVDGAYCIARGNLKISWPAPGKESIVKIASPGDMAGYRCLFSEKRYRGTAVALEEVSVCFVPRDTLFRLAETDSAFSFELLRRMGREIANAESRLHSFCQRSVRERMAEALLVLKSQCGREVAPGRWMLDIQLSREELSSWIGAAKETVVRSLSEFKEEGLLAQENSRMVLLDPAGLARVANLPRA